MQNGTRQMLWESPSHVVPQHAHVSRLTSRTLGSCEGAGVTGGGPPPRCWCTAQARARLGGPAARWSCPPRAQACTRSFFTSPLHPACKWGPFMLNDLTAYCSTSYCT